MIIVKIVVLLIFVISAYKVLNLGSIFFNKSKHLTEKGHRDFAIALVLLIISGIQLFNVFDFIAYIQK